MADVNTSQYAADAAASPTTGANSVTALNEQYAKYSAGDAGGLNTTAQPTNGTVTTMPIKTGDRMGGGRGAGAVDGGSPTWSGGIQNTDRRVSIMSISAGADNPNAIDNSTPVDVPATTGTEAGAEAPTTPQTPYGDRVNPTAGGATGAGTLPLNDTYQGMVGNNNEYIGQMYDAQIAAQLANMENAYQLNLSDMTAQKNQIDAQYNQAANDLATQYERNRRNALEQANINGLNTGVGSQMALAQNSGYQRDFGTLRGQQAAAQTEQDRAINNLTASYRNQIAEAQANNDYARAAALMDEYNRQLSQTISLYQMQYQENADMAALLAAGGDYSGYAQMFGLTDDQTGLLAAQWIANNPDVAYDSGMIDAEQYKAIVGKYPKGYKNGGGGGSGPDAYGAQRDAYKENSGGASSLGEYLSNLPGHYQHGVTQ